ncbi:MAG: thermonuclease family protein [Cyanobacteria bacterium CRU_2_1]|nr:thermonuclease family protein [Cyanobacteria bacterium RU_5_0]NJR59079.1 thermonuclease family protein [Cyanobacteria bacterium CRU_2_1]
MNAVRDWGQRLLASFGVISGLVWLMGCQATIAPQGQSVQVSQVISGQTLEVLDPTQQTTSTERVRLLGIDAPDWNHQQPWSIEAKERLEALIGEDRHVLLESDVEPYVESEREMQGGSRLRLAYVWHGQELLNETLVEEGYGVASSRSPNLKYEQRLIHAQEKARLLGIGIWNPTHSMRQMPSEFRDEIGN